MMDGSVNERTGREMLGPQDLTQPRLVDCVVTAVDGAGRASIGLSSSTDTARSTAVFLCDLERGVIDVIGQLEEESAAAGGLLHDPRIQAAGLGVAGAPELALRLLAGGLLLGGGSVLPSVQEWLERTLGRGFQPRAFPAPTAQADPVLLWSSDLFSRANEILEACPTWLDGSPLTFDLAEELVLREGHVPADPKRDSGAFRFLFEHRIIHRLELYRRMLLWMAWFWESAGEADLASSAQALSWQLSDEQYAVPAHPFVVALTARSLDAARSRLGTEEDPRPARRQH
jgi:hypothetical protein